MTGHETAALETVIEHAAPSKSLPEAMETAP